MGEMDSVGEGYAGRSGILAALDALRAVRQCPEEPVSHFLEWEEWNSNRCRMPHEIFEAAPPG